MLDKDKITPEMVGKARNAMSAKEMMQFAEAEGVLLTEAEAESFYARLNAAEGELYDDELETVAGGCNDCGTYCYYYCQIHTV